MTKQMHDLQQGSDAWHQFRLTHFGASEAAAMLGLSPKVKRSELLHAKKTGIAREFSDWVQEHILDPGHDMEAAARPIIEEIIGEDLYPVTCSDGELSASCDGLTFDDRIAMEHKRWNDPHAAIVAAGEVPPEHMPQCQQVLMVTGAEKLLFVISDGTAENMEHVWVLPDHAWFKRIRAGWQQFAEDLATYVPSTAPATPAPVAAPMESLPAVSVIVSGTITIKENFSAFETALTDFLAHRLIREPKTDQDFADLDVQIKAMKGAEAALDSAEAGWIAQIEPVSTAKGKKDMLHKLVRDNRLMAEKLLASEKDRRKLEIKTGGDTALRAHFDALNTRLGKPYMPTALATADFGGAIKGMRSLSSMEDAVATLLANAKIAANETADKIQANLGTLRELAAKHAFLFADTPQLVLKANDDLRAVITNRIAEHERVEAERLAAERERIAAEERRKAEAAAAESARLAAEEAAKKAREEERERIAQEQAAIKAATQPSAPVAAEPAAAPVQVSTVVAMKPRPAPVAAPAPAAPPTLKLGVIAERLGFSLTAEFLRTLGFEPAAKERGATLYHERDFTFICAALVEHINSVQAKQAA